MHSLKFRAGAGRARAHAGRRGGRGARVRGTTAAFTAAPRNFGHRHGDGDRSLESGAIYRGSGGLLYGCPCRVAAWAKKDSLDLVRFPQVKGLGSSSKAQEYAIGSKEEAKTYLAHPLLGTRLLECCAALLSHGHVSPRDIMGSPDDLKLLLIGTPFLGQLEC